MQDAGANRLLFSHFGPVTDVADTLDRSEEELRYWVEVVEAVHAVEPNLDHAIAMVREKDRERHPVFYADEARVLKFDELSGVGANVNGIVRWLDARQTGHLTSQRPRPVLVELLVELLLRERQAGFLLDPLLRVGHAVDVGVGRLAHPLARLVDAARPARAGRRRRTAAEPAGRPSAAS